MSTVTERVVRFLGHSTWVRIEEPRVPSPGALPLFVLHGGPGMAHNYVRNIAELADETGRTVIHYDQLGCGKSTHLPEAPADFWTPQLFVDEFEAVRAALGMTRFHLLGQSWGGMLGAEIASRQPSGLASLLICNSPASMELWLQGASELRAKLPSGVQEALNHHEALGSLSDPEYVRAVDEFYRRHVCRTDSIPTDFVESTLQMEAEPTVYHTMNGPNEFHVIGSLRDWSIIDELHRINVPAFVIAGEYDEATPLTWRPFVTGISGAQSHVFPGASHCTHLEQPREFRHVVATFLAENDLTPTAPTSDQKVSS